MLPRHDVPPSSHDELVLESVAARGWWPAETAMLGGWLLRADHGITKRANSVLPLGAPDRSLPEALATARSWYAQRGLPLQIQTPTESRRLLDAELNERGWENSPDCHVLTLHLAAAAGGTDGTEGTDNGSVLLSDEPDDAWLQRARPDDAADPDLQALLTRHGRVVFAAVRRSGQTLATARGTLDGTADGTIWLGVTAVAVAPQHRQQGLAGRLMTALHAWGRDAGARRAYLQVESGNAAAIALYAGLGYIHHHDYRFWRDPDS